MFSLLIAAVLRSLQRRIIDAGVLTESVHMKRFLWEEALIRVDYV